MSGFLVLTKILVSHLAVWKLKLQIPIKHIHMFSFVFL